MKWTDTQEIAIELAEAHPDQDLTIEIPKYTINYEREGGGKKP